LAWVVDIDIEWARSLAAGFSGSRATTAVDEVLGDARTNAVDICLPHNLHAEYAVMAAKAGKHVLVEKPLAHSLEAADRMIEAAGRSGVALMVAENVRFEPGLIEAARLVANGSIGEPALVQITREAYLRESFLRDRPWFLDDVAAAGGIMMSGGIHDFDKLRMIVGPACGEVNEVHARRARQRFSEMKGDDTSVATVRFENGAVAVLVESFLMKSEATASGAETHWMRIDGDLGSIVVSNEDTEVRLFSEKPGICEVVAGSPRTKLTTFKGDSFSDEIAHFVECVRSGAEPLTSGRNQRRSLELVLAAYESMRTGLPVRV
jgi:predicted dehydrogenase